MPIFVQLSTYVTYLYNIGLRYFPTQITAWTLLSDVDSFGPVKTALRGHWYSNDGKVKEAVPLWLQMQPKAFFYQGIHIPCPSRNYNALLDKSIGKQGDYVET
jgi:hypothetical protein